ncbi:MAG: hypothetical protein MZV49_06090 [Rhodopseudomonas palustris]|nr:hypothetical protein [Rhodopseudomonas palustris]
MATAGSVAAYPRAVPARARPAALQGLRCTLAFTFGIGGAALVLAIAAARAGAAARMAHGPVHLPVRELRRVLGAPRTDAPPDARAAAGVRAAHAAAPPVLHRPGNGARRRA